MEYIYSVEEATQKFFASLAEATGWKHLKSQRCLKKTVGDLVFEINFFTSKWNASHERVEVNAEFWLRCKSYGKLPVNNVIASMSYHPELYIPDAGYWYDISTENKLSASFEDLNGRYKARLSSCVCSLKTTLLRRQRACFASILSNMTCIWII